EESALARELEEDERIHGGGGAGDARVDEAAIEEAAENIKVQLYELLAEVDLTPVPSLRETAERPVEVASKRDLSVYLAPLVWMNAPLMMLPAWARQAVGVASVILFVAAAGA